MVYIVFFTGLLISSVSPLSAPSGKSKIAAAATSNYEINRRELLGPSSPLSAAAAAALFTFYPSSDATAATETAPPKKTISENGLAAKLAKRDPSVLQNSVFNIPPKAQVYPDFCRGTWEVTSKFNGFIFPSAKIPKSKLLNNFVVPGFQKCSIASLSDVGKEETKFTIKIDPNTGLEDRRFNLAQQIDAYLGYNAVSEVIYDAKANPNRLSVVFVEYKTKNAERIELFCNARESESYLSEENEVFVCSEYVRQVTFGGGSTVGVARQVGGNYAHFYTWKKNNSGDTNQLSGNILTAAYLDPTDSMYFDEPSKPVAIYSTTFSAVRQS